MNPKALETIAERTAWYHFFLQEWASATWNNAQEPAITLNDANQSYSETLASLDAGFFRVRIDRLTKSETQFVKTMSTLGDGPYAMADIAREMRRTHRHLAQHERALFLKG